MRPSVLALYVVLATPWVAHGSELEFEFGTALFYNSSIPSQTADERDDFGAHIEPGVRAFDREGQFIWELRYRPRYVDYLEASEFDGWDHDVFAEFVWHASKRTTLRVSDRFLDVLTQERLTETVVDETVGEAPTELGSGGLQRNVVHAELSHMLAIRHRLSLTADNYDTDYDAVGRADNQTSSVSLSYLYFWDAGDRVGAFIRYSRQRIESLGAASETDFYNASVQWVHQFSPTLNLNLSVGPALVDSAEPEGISVSNAVRYPLLFGRNVRASTCPTLDDGTPFLDLACQTFPFAIGPGIGQTVDLELTGPFPEESDLTYFATIVLTKEWQSLVASLRYARDTSTFDNARAAGGSVSDVLSLVLDWRPAERWRVITRVIYTRRESATEQLDPVVALRAATLIGIPDVAEAFALRPISRDVSVRDQIFDVGLGVAYRLTKRTNLWWRGYYTHQDVSPDPLGTATTDRFRIFVGFTYTFERIPLPI